MSQNLSDDDSAADVLRLLSIMLTGTVSLIQTDLAGDIRKQCVFWDRDLKRSEGARQAAATSGCRGKG